MGGGGKGGTSTSTVSIPPEVLARYNAVNARAEEVAKKPFEAYTGEFVAPITEEQQQGISQTQKYSEAAQPYYARAAGMTEDAYKASQPLTADQIQQYQNPYIQSVVDPTLKALQQQQAIDRQGQTAQAIKSGAFGGERAGLQRAVTTGQQELAQAQAISPLYASAYQNALATAQQQQGQRVAAGMQAGQQTAGIGTGAQQAGLQGGQAVIGAGTLKQQTAQALDTAKYQQFLQERGYDFQTAQFLANIAEGTGALSGSTTTTNQPTSFFSDERLKHDIKQIGKTNDGQPIYSFKYKGDNRTQIGLLAQEVEKKHPEAVGLSGGYKTVDYAKATASSRHARAMGGLVPESMGGAVYEPGNFSRGGFAYGGDPEDLKAILAQQKQSFGPFAQSGLYGGSSQQDPHGAAPGYVPKASLHVPKLTTSNFQPRQQQGEFQSALQNINAAGKAAETLSGGYDWAKQGYKKLTEKPKDPNATPDSNVAGPSDKTVSDTGRTVTIKPPASPSQMNPSAPKTTGFGNDEYIDPNLDPTAFSVPVAHGGGIMPRHHYAGGGFLDPYKEPTSGSMIPEDVMQDSEETKGEAEKLAPKPAGGSGGGGGGGSGLMGAASTIGSLYGAAKGIGAMGTFLSSLPFFSDERLKDNIKQVGKTFDGQNIYSYDMGDGRTQMGLLAQEVLHHKPEAVGKDQGYLTVDYRKATEDSAPHRAAGGIVPRHGYQTAGGVPATDPLAGYDPKDLAIRTIAAETGGNPEETAGIAAVVRNRLASGNYGPDYRSVVTAKNQFEPWNNPQGANYPLRIDPESDRYKQAAAALTRHETEGYDPTDGATHFWAPKAQTALGRKAPSWDNENAKDIGATRFVKVDASGAPRQQAPQQQQPQQAYPFQQQIEGGLGKAKSMADSLAPRTYQGQDRSMGEFLTSRDFVIPLLTGLGTMASSPSRYLGAAILQGLGGGAQAFANLQKQQADIGQTLATTGLTGMETEGKRQEMVTGAFKVQTDGRATITYRDRDGSIKLMPAAEYYALPKDKQFRLDPISEAALQEYARKTGLVSTSAPAPAPAPTAGGLGAGKDVVTPPPGAVTTPPPAGEVTPPPPAGAPSEMPQIPGVNINPDHLKQIQERAQTLENQGNAVISAQPRAKAYDEQAALATAAQAQRPQMMSFAGALAALPRGNNVLTSGKQQEVLQPLAAVLNGLASTVGLPNFVNAQALANSEEVKKSVNIMAQQAAKGGNQASYSALSEIMSSIPSNLNSPGAQAKLISDIMAVQQREIDKDKYFAAVKKQAEGPNGIYSRGVLGTGAEAERAFNDSNGAKIEQEKQQLARMYNKQVPGYTDNGRPVSMMEYLAKNAGTLNEKQRATIESNYGKGILRYFGVGG